MQRSRARLATVALSALLSACAQGEPAQLQEHEHRASPGCPLSTPAAWQEFLQSSADRPRWTTTCSDMDDCQAAVGDFAVEVQEQVLDVLARCQPDIADNPPIALCTERLRAFVPAWLRQHASHDYGFDQPNTDYWARQVEPDKPEHLMDPPLTLLAALPQRSQLEAVARAQGFPYLVHDSGLGGARLFVLVGDPQGRFEQWLVFGLDEKLERVADEAIVSFIGLQKKNQAGALLQRPIPHFRDYLAHQRAGAWQLELPADFPGKCSACHVNGLRQLLTGRGSVLEAQPVRGDVDFGQQVDAQEHGRSRLADFNARIAAYGAVDWGDSLAPQGRGPALGEALGCTDCHDGWTRGALSVFTSEGMLWQKVVQQLSMRRHDGSNLVPDSRASALLEQETVGVPPLTGAEAAELDASRAAHVKDFEALMASRLPDLQRWLLAAPCD
jgi:hypothetical protein